MDLTTQARVLDLLFDLQRRTGVAYLFITHNLSVVRRISRRIALMYRGVLVETGPTAQVTEEPGSDYTRRLVLASPTADPDRQRERGEARRLSSTA